MTCMNCGSTAVQPNGWCSACGQPASPPQPTAWPAPPQQPSWAAPTQQQSWAAPIQQQSWAAPAPSEWNAPHKHDELTPPRDETPRLQQGEWQAQHAAHQGQWETQQQEQRPAQPGQWETPQQGQAAHQAQWETQQQGQWAQPQGHEQPLWAAAQQDRGVPPEQPTWATDATSTFGVSSPPANTYQAPPAHQPPPTDATVVGDLPSSMQQPAPSSYANPPALDATVVGGLPAYPQQPPPQPAPPMDATVVGAYPQQSPAPGSPAGYPQQPGFNQPPPYMVSNQAPQAAAVHRSGNPFSIVAFVLAGISLLLFPALVGPLGIIFGAVALFRRERLGRLALILAFVGLIGGVALGMAVNSLL